MEKVLEPEASPDFDVKKLNSVSGGCSFNKKPKGYFRSSESYGCKNPHLAWQACLKTLARSKRKAFEVTKIGIWEGDSPHGSNIEI